MVLERRPDRLTFEFYVRATVWPEGRVMITKSPLPFAVGHLVPAEDAISILEEVKRKFNEEIDEILKVLREIKEFREKYR